MNQKYKILLFDLDNTLVDDDENRKFAIKQVLFDRREEVTYDKIDRFIALDNQFWKDRAAGKIKNPYEFKNDEEKTKWVRAQRFLNFFKDISFEEAVKINDSYIRYLKDNIVPIKNSEVIIDYLYKKQYEIYVVTNSPQKVLNDKLSKINAQKYIKDIFSAEEAGHMKPHKVFFEKMFQKIGSDNVEDMLIVGDELEKDVLGGIQNGIDSCWVNLKKADNNTEFKPTYEINELIELKNLL